MSNTMLLAYLIGLVVGLISAEVGRWLSPRLFPDPAPAEPESASLKAGILGMSKEELAEECRRLGLAVQPSDNGRFRRADFLDALRDRGDLRDALRGAGL